MTVLKGVAVCAFSVQLGFAYVLKVSAASKGQSTQQADQMIESAKKGLETALKP